MHRTLCIAIVLAASLMLPGQLPISVQAASRLMPRATFTIPRSNVASSGPVLDDRRVVYGVAAPRLHRPVCVSCGQKPFTNFRVHVYMRDYRERSGALTVSQPHLLFVGPRGAQIVLDSLAAGWLVYDTDTPEGQWRLFARNVETDRVILLAGPAMKFFPGYAVYAGTDGRTIVWQSWRGYGNHTRSVVWSYSLATGRRKLLLTGGIGSGDFTGDPQIAGNHLILVRATGSTPGSQILVENLATHRLRALTPLNQTNFEPAISGNIVVWVHGSITLGHSHGLVVMNLATGRRVAVKRSSSQLPRVVAGRYVVFAPDYPTPNPQGTVQVYDALTGARRTIVVGPDAHGFVPNWTIEAGGHAALVEMDKPSGNPTGLPATYFELVPLGPG